MLTQGSQSTSRKTLRFKTSKQKYRSKRPQRTTHTAPPQTTGLTPPSPQFCCPISVSSLRKKFPKRRSLQVPGTISRHLSQDTENSPTPSKVTCVMCGGAINHREQGQKARQDRSEAGVPIVLSHSRTCSQRGVQPRSYSHLSHMTGTSTEALFLPQYQGCHSS